MTKSRRKTIPIKTGIKIAMATPHGLFVDIFSLLNFFGFYFFLFILSYGTIFISFNNECYSLRKAKLLIGFLFGLNDVCCCCCWYFYLSTKWLDLNPILLLIFHFESMMMAWFAFIWVWYFIAIWQCIHDGVVEQAVVAIAPWESLSANVQMFVCNELWSRLFGVLHVAQVSVDHAQCDGWEANEKGQVTP